MGLRSSREYPLRLLVVDFTTTGLRVKRPKSNSWLHLPERQGGFSPATSQDIEKFHSESSDFPLGTSQDVEKFHSESSDFPLGTSQDVEKFPNESSDFPLGTSQDIEKFQGDPRTGVLQAIDIHLAGNRVLVGRSACGQPAVTGLNEGSNLFATYHLYKALLVEKAFLEAGENLGIGFRKFLQVRGSLHGTQGGVQVKR